MATQAALDGLGAALAPQFFVEREIAALVTARGMNVKSGLSYYLIYPEGQTGGNAFHKFREWLLEHAAISHA